MARIDNHRKHVFFLHGVWELPFGKGREISAATAEPSERNRRRLAGEYGIYTWQSGLPFTPSYRDCNADRDTGWCRPDLVGELEARQSDCRSVVRDHAVGSGRARHAPHRQRADARPLAPARTRHVRDRRPQPAVRSVVLAVGPVVVQELRRDRPLSRTVPRRSVQLPKHVTSRTRTPASIVRERPGGSPTFSSWPPCASGSLACGWNSDPARSGAPGLKRCWASTIPERRVGGSRGIQRLSLDGAN